ncbi:hypothetical protein [Chryseolinea soli]|uniref:Uncharacterized protein n=1 Tax=Chryseolinea soli TaxID=2321403 RepID=A0A385SHJ9_9BACT|nr:hypothetical protein [Chryseolinea soli]AYB29747.1 hypothetical protein D4L85_03775 [Chryseolinea soli]
MWNKWTLVSCALAVQLLSCNKDERVRERFKTQSKFHCQIVVDRNQYEHDSILLVKKLSSIIEDKEDPYNALAFDKNTIVNIDTILYDSQKRHCAIFVILKIYEPITKVWVYDGLVHFAELDSNPQDSLNWDIYAHHGAIHINSETYEKMSYILRFHNLAGRSYTGYLNNRQEFNLDDCRFWDSLRFKDTIQQEGFY